MRDAASDAEEDVSARPGAAFPIALKPSIAACDFAASDQASIPQSSRGGIGLMTSPPKITDQDIEIGLSIAARIVLRYGEVYWPVFERLETELRERRSRSARLNAYLPAEHKTMTSSPHRKAGATGSVVSLRSGLQR